MWHIWLTDTSQYLIFIPLSCYQIQIFFNKPSFEPILMPIFSRTKRKNSFKSCWKRCRKNRLLLFTALLLTFQNAYSVWVIKGEIAVKNDCIWTMGKKLGIFLITIISKFEAISHVKSAKKLHEKFLKVIATEVSDNRKFIIIYASCTC